MFDRFVLCASAKQCRHSYIHCINSAIQQRTSGIGFIDGSIWYFHFPILRKIAQTSSLLPDTRHPVRGRRIDLFFVLPSWNLGGNIEALSIAATSRMKIRLRSGALKLLALGSTICALHNVPQNIQAK